MDPSTYEILIATTVSTLGVFLGDLLRRLIFPRLKLRDDLARREAGLDPDPE